MAQRQWRSDDTDKWKHSFGKGLNGSTYAVPANEGCSSTLASKTLTLASAGGFSDGDLILIHQTRGTNAGHWELNKILSGGGTTTLTLESDTTLAYSDSGADQAQVIELNQYNGLTTGSINAPNWDGSKGGIIAFFDKGTTTVSGTLNLNGTTATTISGVSGRGFAGGTGKNGSTPQQCWAGEGTSGPTVTQRTANGNGGGGTNIDAVSFSGGGGGGGGNGTAGSNGGTRSGHNEYGFGGSTGGNASLTSIVHGGGGGGAGNDGGAVPGGGGSGAGIAFIFSSDLTISGSITANGGNGDSAYAGGGAGAGGSVLLKCQTATLGSNLITASGGTGGSGSGDPLMKGGNGGVGRIHIDYSDSFTGTTSPAIDSTLDTTITAGATGNFFMFF